MPKGKYYITTAIAYTSKKPHIGNTYEIVLTDSIARFKRLLGYDVFFLTGTDEHGQKIEQLAQEAGITPKEYVDRVAGEIRVIWDLMNTSYDKFIRTTDSEHVSVVQKIFKKLYEQGDIYKSEYEGLYCIPCESFFTETQLIDECCPDCGRPVTSTKEEAYFFKMSKYQDDLTRHIEDNPEFIQPESRKREMINNFLKPGLQDLCVSRTSFSWGIPVSFDEKHVVYVWIDALSNYITALGYDPDGSSERYKKYWPAEAHVIGKDILRFHTIYWPIMLMALGEPLPKQIFGHPWLLSGTDKMSKSKGNVIYADDLVRHFGVDGVRYYLLSEMPFASDGTITYETVIARYNSELANTLGNLVNRTVAMVNKYYDGVIAPIGKIEDVDLELKEAAKNAVASVEVRMETFRVADALEEVLGLAKRANKYIDQTAPWVLAKDDEGRLRLGTVLYNLIEAIRIIGVLISPFMPDTATKIFAQINADETTWESILEFGKTKEGTKVGEAEALFARLDEVKKLEEIYAEIGADDKEEVLELDLAPEISIDDFAKLDLKIGKVLEVLPVKGSDKLYKIQLDMGGIKRQVVSGIAEHYKADELIGKNVIVIANLKPVKLRGEISNGMILAAESNGKVVLCTTDADVEPGSGVR